MRAFSTILPAVLAVNLLAGCASTPPVVMPASYPAQERVTPERWSQAQELAARLSGGALSLADARPTQLVHLPHAMLCDMLGQCPHAAVYGRSINTAFFRDDRPWRSDGLRHFAIVIHEAAHSLQSADTIPDCREVQAHAIQAAWLREVARDEMALDVESNARGYDCGAAATHAAVPW